MGKAAAMKCLAVALMFAASAADESCKDQAVANKFRGDEFKSFKSIARLSWRSPAKGARPKGFG
jgi:hypothetical protein